MRTLLISSLVFLSACGGGNEEDFAAPGLSQPIVQTSYPFSGVWEATNSVGSKFKLIAEDDAGSRVWGIQHVDALNNPPGNLSFVSTGAVHGALVTQHARGSLSTLPSYSGVPYNGTLSLDGFTVYLPPVFASFDGVLKKSENAVVIPAGTYKLITHNAPYVNLEIHPNGNITGAMHNNSNPCLFSAYQMPTTKGFNKLTFKFEKFDNTKVGGCGVEFWEDRTYAGIITSSDDGRLIIMVEGATMLGGIFAQNNR